MFPIVLIPTAFYHFFQVALSTLRSDDTTRFAAEHHSPFHLYGGVLIVWFFLHFNTPFQ